MLTCDGYLFEGHRRRHVSALDWEMSADLFLEHIPLHMYRMYASNMLANHIKKPVFRIHDILGWIRIRIHGSMPLTNGSVSGFGSCYFRH
jgi:hypothetical protein